MGLLQYTCLLLIGGFHLAACGSVQHAALRPDATHCNYNLMITGGHKITIKDAPYFVSVLEEDPEDDYSVLCGGSVIHERFVLTSASCFDQSEHTRKSVHTGSETLLKGVIIKVEQEFCHNNFDTLTLNNDICLLKLATYVPYGWMIKLALPQKNYELTEGAQVNVTGWGATDSNLEADGTLRQVTVPVLSQKCCDDIYSGYNDDQICAGAWHRDFCKGDTGGPLTRNGVQVGIISGAGECGKYPGAYTKVSSYVDWIADIIKNNP